MKVSISGTRPRVLRSMHSNLLLILITLIVTLLQIEPQSPATFLVSAFSMATVSIRRAFTTNRMLLGTGTPLTLELDARFPTRLKQVHL